MAKPLSSNLRRKIIENSVSDDFEEALGEWSISGVDEDRLRQGVCECNQTGLRYLYSIHNRVTDVSLCPIGSECILAFESDALSLQLRVLQKLVKLCDAYQSNGWQPVGVNGENFSYALLEYLYEGGIFAGLNRSQSEVYGFMVDMFGRRCELTSGQERFAALIQRRCVMPYVRHRFAPN